MALNEIALKLFSYASDAGRVQKRYLREGGLWFCGQYSHPKDFYDRLELLNKYLKYFPVRQGKNQAREYLVIPVTPLEEDELIDCLDKARTAAIRKMMLGHGDNARKYTHAHTYVTKLEQWHKNVKLTESLEAREKEGTSSPSPNKRKGGNSEGSPSKKHKGNSTKKKRENPCVHCGKMHIVPDDKCWSNPNNKDGDKKKPHDKKDWKQKFNNAVSRQVSKEVTKATQQLKKAFSERLSTPKKRRNVIMSDDESMTEIAEGYAAKIAKAFDAEELQSDNDSEISFSYLPSTPSTYAFYENSRKQKKGKKTHYTAEVVVEIEDRHGDLVPIRCLLDTGTSDTIVLRDFVRKGRAKSYKGQPTVWNTMGGNFITKQKALIDFKFPELENNKQITWICHVDDKTNRKTALYDMIVGMDLMTEIGIYVNTETKEVQWKGQAVPLKERGVLQSKSTVNFLYHMAVNPVLHEAEERQARILDANYNKVDIGDFCENLQHLSKQEQVELQQTLELYPRLFGGGLGKLHIDPIHLELKPDAKAHAARAFPVPQSLQGTTKKEMDRLTDIGVFEKNSDSEWAAPTFVQPKKTGDIRILTDFRRLNDNLVRKPYPLPRISELLQKLRNFKYATAIDLSMGYYHIPLDEASQKLCTTVLPWGKFRYKVLPMGIKNSPDIFQEIINNMFCDLEFTSAYLDDILIISDGSYQDHLDKVKVVLERLQRANFRANMKKCYFAESNIEYLGYQVTRQGIQPQPKKVEAIHKLKPPKNVRQLRHFLGMVNYYRDMWQRRSHILAPLTKMVGKNVPFQWDREQQEAFDEIKRVMSKQTILAFPDFKKPFHIYTDASNTQLGAVIMQDDKPLAFYSRKLNSAQKNYTTGEQELLSIVETLKEFRSLLWGQDLTVHTDHMNIIYGNLSNDRITRWRLLLEEYSPTFVHVKGTDNVVADALSRMDKISDFDEQEQKNRLWDPQDIAIRAKHITLVMTQLDQDHSVYLPDATDPLQMATCYTKKQDMELEKFPMHPELINTYQKKDKQCKKYYKDKEKFKVRSIEGTKLITKDNKIVIPFLLQERIMAWYHLYLRHPGANRMEKTLSVAFWWSGLRKDVERYVRTCHECQINKKVRNKYGKLLPKEAEHSEPWKRVNIDLIGPLTVKTPSGSYKLNALTMIDPATGWFEVKEVAAREAHVVAKAFDEAWLSRYPRPKYIGFDNGSENKGVFSETVDNYGLIKKPSTTYNPQSNGIVERVHAVLNDMLRTFELEERELDDSDPWSEFLSAAAFAIRATYHTTLQATPAQLVFGRDMILPVAITADWERIREKRQDEINRNNLRENRDRIPHEYKVGDKVLLRKEGILRKLTAPREGPYELTRVYNNGTVQLQHGAVKERVNIRRIIPYLEK